MSAVEEGRGHLLVDDAPSPRAAVLFYGRLVIYAGDPQVPGVVDLVRSFPFQTMILDYDPGWHRLLVSMAESAGSSGSPTPGRRWHLPADSFRGGANPPGTSSGLDDVGPQSSGQQPVPRAAQLDDIPTLQDSLGWEHQLYHYVDGYDFLDRAHPYVIEESGRIVAGASSFVTSQAWAECQVSTSEAYRGRGLGTLVAKAYLQAAQSAGLTVPWDAANESSVRLGTRLGYEEVREYAVLDGLTLPPKSW